MGIGSLEHSHEMNPNPLNLKVHLQRHPDQAKAMELARTHRRSGLTHKQSLTLLENTVQDPEELLTVTKKQYYNLIPATTRSLRDVIEGLLETLTSENFLARKRYDIVKDETTGATVKRILAQIVIIDKEQKRLAKRFCSEYMMQDDATFNTNKQQLLLFVAVGITNTNHTFPAAFSFATSESDIAFTFFLDVLKDEIFNDRHPPKVNISDQGGGLITFLPNVFPSCQIQLCSLHAVKNIRARVGQAKRG